MLKRIILWLLVTVLLVGMTASASAAAYDTLWEKLYKQVEKGSAFKAEFQFTSDPQGLLKLLGLDLNGATGTLTYVHDVKNHNLYEMKGTLTKADAATNTFTLTGDDEVHTLSASWLDAAISLGRDLLTGLTTANRTEKDVVEALFANDDAKWQTKVAKAGDSYRLEVETWLAQYAQISDVVDGRMTIIYTLPAADLKAEIKLLFEKLLNDADLLKLLGEKLPAEVVERYLDPRWATQYGGILEAMPLPGDLVITRVQNVMGEVESTHLSLPIPEALSQYGHTLTYQVDELNWHVGLVGEENTFIFTWKKQAQADTAAGELVLESQNGLNLNLGFDASWTTTEWVDEKNRDHESLTVQLNIQDLHGDKAGYLTFAPITVTYEDELRSKNTQDSATYIKKGIITLTLGEATDTLNFTGQSAAPWKGETQAAGAAQSYPNLEAFAQQMLSFAGSFFH